MERFRQQIKKGVLDLLVLAMVAEHPTYGYQLISAMAKKSGNLFTLKEGTLYPVLYRLEDDGLITAKWQEGDGRAKPKKYYEATPKGLQSLDEWKEIWKAFSTCVQQMLLESKTVVEGEQ